jgi:hypothetical protein
MNKGENKVQAVLDKAADHLDELFEMLMDEAKGVQFVVSPRIRAAPRNADFETEAEEVLCVCKACNQPIVVEPRVAWNVYRERRDAATIKFLYEQAAGRAKSREQDKIDTEIFVVFGDIDSLPGEYVSEPQAVNEENGLMGSPPRRGRPRKVTAEDRLEQAIEPTTTEKVSYGLEL